jgi:tetratricopeptide (TPR) repeat protein
MGQREIEQAIRSFQEASTLDPTHSLPHIALGVALLEAGNFEQSELAYEDALALGHLPQNQPYVQPAWLNLGLLRYKMGQSLAISDKTLAQTKYADAETSFANAISSAPNVKSPDAHQQMGIMQQLQDKHDEGATSAVSMCCLLSSL